MKKAYYLIIMLLFLFGFSGGANAALIDQGNGIIYDSTSLLYWYQDLDEFEYRTYAQQISDIAALPHANGSWHMATASEMEGLWNYTAQQIAGNFNSTSFELNTEWWTGRYDQVASAPEGRHYLGSISCIESEGCEQHDLGGLAAFDIHASDNYGAWVVTDTNPVPIPSAAILLGSGLIGLIGIRRRHKKD